jgi:dipeptide/tripeptide permease
MVWYRRAVVVLSALCIVIGFALLAVSAADDRGVAGYALGAVFLVVGVARLTAERRRSSQTRQ